MLREPGVRAEETDSATRNHTRTRGNKMKSPVLGYFIPPNLLVGGKGKREKILNCTIQPLFPSSFLVPMLPTSGLGTVNDQVNRSLHMLLTQG